MKHCMLLVSIVVLAYAGCCLGDVWIDWVEKPAPLLQRHGAEGTIVGDTLYLTGGTIGGFGQNTFQAYDLGTGSGSELPSLKDARSAHGVFADGDSLYAFGGCSNSSAGTPSVERYDLSAGSWNTVGSLPDPLRFFGTAKVGNTAYAIGGESVRQPGQFLKSMLQYDIGGNKWTTGPDALMPGVLFPSTSYGSKVFSFGGQGPGNSLYSATQVYDAGLGTWSLGANMPVPAREAGAGVLGDRIYVVGGSDLARDLKTVQVYDPVHNTWDRGTDLPVGMNNAFVGSHAGKLYVTDGTRMYEGMVGPPSPPASPMIGVMLGAPVTTKMYEDLAWRNRYAERILDPALARIGRDAPGSCVKFFVPWGDRKTLGGGLDSGWAYNHQIYSGVLSDDKSHVILSNSTTRQQLSAADIDALVDDYCRNANWSNLQWLMDRIRRNGLKAYPILGDGGGTPKIGSSSWLTPDNPEQYVAQLYIHARAVARKLATGALPGGDRVTLIQVENETNYAAVHPLVGGREQSALWGNPEVQEAMVVALRTAVRDEYRAQFMAGTSKSPFMPLVAADLHAGYETIGDWPGGTPFPEAAANLAKHVDLIALNDYAFLAPSTRDATVAALTRLAELVWKLQGAGVSTPAYIGETTYPSFPSGVYPGNPPFNPIAQADFLKNAVLSFSLARGEYPSSVPTQPIFFWYQLADAAGLETIGLPVNAGSPILPNPDLYTGLFAVGPNGPVRKPAYDAFIDSGRSNGLPSYRFNAVSAVANAMFDLVNADRTPAGWNSEGNVEIVDIGGNSCVLLSEGSDAAIKQVIDLVKGHWEMRFEFRFADVGEGDRLQVRFDGQTIWEIAAVNYSGDDFFLAPVIDLPDLEGGKHLLEIRLSGVGEAGAKAWVDNVGVVVPEPTSAGCLVLGCAMMLQLCNGRRIHGGKKR